MRWDGHRESTDIDVLIGADAVTTLWEMVDGPRLAGLDERVGRRGWTLLADGLYDEHLKELKEEGLIE